MGYGFLRFRDGVADGILLKHLQGDANASAETLVQLPELQKARVLGPGKDHGRVGCRESSDHSEPGCGACAGGGKSCGACGGACGGDNGAKASAPTRTDGIAEKKSTYFQSMPGGLE